MCLSSEMRLSCVVALLPLASALCETDYACAIFGLTMFLILVNCCVM